MTSARTLMKWLLTLLLWPAMIFAEGYDPLDYRSGFSVIQDLGRQIHGTLERSHRALISPQPINLDTSRKPFVRPLYHTDGTETIRGVWVSQGFIDLVNHVAHAKAISRKRKGYFAEYVKLLESAEDYIPPLPDRKNPAFWTEEMINEQASNFIQIVGSIVGIQLSHHYLGLYNKYKDQLEGPNGEPVPLNNLLTHDEWEQSYRRGVIDAMNAACMTDGFIPFCEALSSMKRRPSWVGFFLPDGVRFDLMRKDLVRLQEKFLND